MDTDITIELFEELNRKMKKDKSRIVLFLDNATFYASKFFLHANTSSVSQPLNLGVT